MATIIFVIKLFSTLQPKLRLLCRLSGRIRACSHGGGGPQVTNRNGQTRSVKCSHFGILSAVNRLYFKLFLLTYEVNGSSRSLTPRHTLCDAFMNKYICVQEWIFRLSRGWSLGRLYSNSLIASATTTLRNLTPATRGCKTVGKRVLFFDHG